MAGRQVDSREMVTMSLSGAVDRALDALGDSDMWVAEAVMVRMLAAALDEKPWDTDLWREFRLALKSLREAAGGSDIDDKAAELLERLGGTAVRNAKD